MEHGNWNMQWNMEIGTCNGTWKLKHAMENGMGYRMEHAMEWNLFYFFIKAKTVLFPAAVCVPIATEIWNRPMEHMLIIKTDVSFLQKQQETTGVNIF